MNIYYNGGTPQQSQCNCKISYSGQCCMGGEHFSYAIIQKCE